MSKPDGGPAFPQLPTDKAMAAAAVLWRYVSHGITAIVGGPPSLDQTSMGQEIFAEVIDRETHLPILLEVAEKAQQIVFGDEDLEDLIKELKDALAKLPIPENKKSS